MNLNRARELRKNMTDTEQLLWKHLRAHRLAGYKFKRQQPIGAYIVDFVCFTAHCIVEADGGQHLEQAEYDARRDAWLKSQGFTVLRFWNNDILTNTEGVLETIVAACRANAPSPQPLSHQGRGANSGNRGNEQDGSQIGSGHNAASEKPNQTTSTSPLPTRDDCMDAGGRTTSGTNVERGRGKGGNGI